MSLAALLVCPVAAAQSVRVDEAATRLELQANSVQVTLVVENPAAREQAVVQYELLNLADLVCARSEWRGALERGRNTTAAELPFGSCPSTDAERAKLPLYRLRYRVILDDGSKTVQGIIGVSQVTPELFALKVFVPRFQRSGASFPVQVRALHPITHKPAAGVQVEAALTLEEEEKPSQKAAATTDADGLALLTFKLPADTSGSFRLQVHAKRGWQALEVNEDGDIESPARLLLHTDKPIYQPGQTLHARLFLFDPDNRVLADEPVAFTLHGPDDLLVSRQTLRTSRFGIARFDWDIPQNSRLGEYQLTAELEEDTRGWAAQRTIRVSRYELPTFSVTVTPDRAYYLPGQDAVAQVRAEYLFGQPVNKGRVRIVRESEREWDVYNRQWTTKEEESYEATVDADGQASIRLPLSAAHASLASSDYQHFEDLDYNAYFTDATTDRTEQRRFRIRITREPIHVYLVGEPVQTPNFPLRFYVTAFYADGTPAVADVVVHEIWSKDDLPTFGRPSKQGKVLTTVRTNRYGVAKIIGVRLSEAPDADADLYLSLQVHDDQGNEGRWTREIYGERALALAVDTDKVFYRSGEPIKVHVESSKPDALIGVLLLRKEGALDSRKLRLKDGRGSAVFAYRQEFGDEVTVVVFSLDGHADSPYDVPFASRSVLFPRPPPLALEMQLDHGSYRPGEAVEASFSLRSNPANLQPGALGFLVFDKAVEERALADGDIDSPFGFTTEIGETARLGSLSRTDLKSIDLSKSLPEGLELAAEVLLIGEGWYVPSVSDEGMLERDLSQAFSAVIGPQFKWVSAALAQREKARQEHPRDQAGLERILSQAGIDFDRLEDPWGMPYHANFSTVGVWDRLSVVSAGPDKEHGTGDDLQVLSESWKYFCPVGEVLDRAVAAFHQQTGGFVRDAETLKQLLSREGIDFDQLRDPWGGVYRLDFGIEREFYTVHILSAGPDGRFTPELRWRSDDVEEWENRTPYFEETLRALDAALGEHYRQTKSLPNSEEELRTAIRPALEWNSLRDPWGRPYYARFRTEEEFTDRVTFYSLSRYGEAPQRREHITPITRELRRIEVWSQGEDGRPETSDDFAVGTIVRLLAERSAEEPTPTPSKEPVFQVAGTGGIRGTVVDPAGAIIPNATVEAVNQQIGRSYKTKTGDDGAFYLRNLPVGVYEVRFDGMGFRSLVVTDVPVRADSFVTLNIRLEVGAVTETVEVSAGAAPSMQTTAAMAAVTKSPDGTEPPQPVFIPRPRLIGTPRLRQSFLETLLWEPEIEFDAQGRAQVKFALADNITSWKFSAIASNLRGEIATAEREVTAFQPFFVEHAPPPVLTVGDEIALPVLLRNYLDVAQSVDLEMKPAPWMTLQGQAHQRLDVAAGSESKAVFDFRAITPVEEGKSQVVALGEKASDAVEKSVRVRPDGREVSQTTSRLVREAGALEVTVPPEVIPGTAHAELRLYPNLASHLLQGIEGIVQRPYGCAEQAISVAYPSLLLLRYLEQTHKDAGELGRRARRMVQLGYERLLSYRMADGGFSYWGHGESDPALTAYAVKFLTDAEGFIDIDEDALTQARRWLLDRQQPDGRWQARTWQGQEDRQRSTILTAWIARALAATKPAADSPEKAAVVRALKFLSERAQEMDEPYLIASLALTAQDIDERAAAVKATEMLRTLARQEADTTYWNLETNTPFYGWGRAGRAETTALAVQALARGKEPESDLLAQKGILFLLHEKDRFGVWYSTQTTVRVLETLFEVFSKEESQMQGGGSAEVFVNGQPAGSLTLPPAGEFAGPLSLDLSRNLIAGTNRVELRASSGAPLASAQVQMTYFVRWSAAQSGPILKQESSALRLAVTFDRIEAAVGESITCRVSVERIGFRGYGMILAEIGLPPGADVDRASLDRAVTESGWDLSSYDVLPDRLLVYLWPQAGGTQFEFKFRPRFGLRAKTAASEAYDYYNPDARATLPPTPFLIAPLEERPLPGK